MRSAIHDPINFGPMVRGSGVVLAGILCWLYELEHISLMTLLIIIGLSSDVDRGRPERHRGGWGLALAGGKHAAHHHLIHRLGSGTRARQGRADRRAAQLWGADGAKCALKPAHWGARCPRDPDLGHWRFPHPCIPVAAYRIVRTAV